MQHADALLICVWWLQGLLFICGAGASRAGALFSQASCLMHTNNPVLLYG